MNQANSDSAVRHRTRGKFSSLFRFAAEIERARSVLAMTYEEIAQHLKEAHGFETTAGAIRSYRHRNTEAIADWAARNPSTGTTPAFARESQGKATPLQRDAAASEVPATNRPVRRGTAIADALKNLDQQQGEGVWAARERRASEFSEKVTQDLLKKRRPQA